VRSEKIEVLTVATLVARNANGGYGSAYGGVWRSLRLAEEWSQAVGFMLVRLAGIWLQYP
jgi:hypothetical protein